MISARSGAVWPIAIRYPSGDTAYGGGAEKVNDVGVVMRVLVCDDHPIVLLSMTMLIEASGHEVVATTDDPSEVAGLVDSQAPDVCLLDLLFHGDPTASLQAVQRVAPLTEVIVVTGTMDGAQRAAALEAGASAVASKGLPSDDLIALIEGRADATSSPRRGAPANADPWGLTAREYEVLSCLIDGDCTSRIATRLTMRNTTVRSHVQNLLLKMGVHTRAAAVARAIGEGVITIGP